MAQIAASLNTNPGQLSKMFIKEVGITFAQYLRENKQSSH
jgi:YesN/AraC family two-component response regulator